MKATYAHKTTKCLECSQDIVPTPEGTRRLTDTIFLLATQRVTRVHYHLACYLIRCERWWEENVYAPQGRGGRSRLPITPESRTKRRALLKRLSYLRRTYSEDARKGVADIYQRLAGATDVAEALKGISMNEQEAYHALRKETRDILNELSSADLGGLPIHLRSM
jgi:hypothetical protein